MTQGYWDGQLRTTRVLGDGEDTPGDKIEALIHLAWYNQETPLMHFSTLLAIIIMLFALSALLLDFLA